MELNQKQIVNCDFFTIWKLCTKTEEEEKSEKSAYLFDFKTVDKIKPEDKELMYKSLHMLCDGEDKRAANILLIDTNKVTNVKMVKEIFKLQMSEMLKIPKTTLKEMYVISKFSSVVFSTNLIAKMQNSADIVHCEKNKDEVLAKIFF